MSRNASLEREILFRCGMMAWMDAWSERSPRCGGDLAHAGSGEAVNRMDGAGRPALPEGLRGQVTQLLAGIAWEVARS